MTKTPPHDPVFLSLLTLFLLLPLAHVKLSVWGVPLYLPEIAIGCALFFVFKRLWVTRSALRWSLTGDTTLLIGALLFFSGAIASFLTNPVSLTGLGMLKSWFFFPMIGAWLVFREAQCPKKRLWFIGAWLVALSCTALGSVWYWQAGIMTYDHRLTAWYPSPNFLAIFLAPGVLLVWFGLTRCHKSGYRCLLGKALLWCSGFVLLMSIFLSRSYGALGALFVASLIMVLGQRHLARQRRVSVLVVSLLMAVVVGIGWGEYGSEKWHAMSSFAERSSMASRLMIWQSAIKIVEDHWFFGIGVGRFQVMYLQYQHYFPPYLEWAVPEPHNWYVAVLLSTGVVGFGGFVLLLSRFLVLARRFLQSDALLEKRQFLLLVVAILCLYLGYGLMDTPYFRNDLALSFWLTLGLGLAVMDGDDNAGAIEERR